MSAILKFDFQKREQLGSSEVNYLNYTKKTPILHVATISLYQGETRTSHGPIPHLLTVRCEMTSLTPQNVFEFSKRVTNEFDHVL